MEGKGKRNPERPRRRYRPHRKTNDCLSTLREADKTPGECTTWNQTGAQTAYADIGRKALPYVTTPHTL